MDNWRTACINAYDSEENLLIKALHFGEKMHRFVMKVLMHINCSSYAGGSVRVGICVCKR